MKDRELIIKTAAIIYAGDSNNYTHRDAVHSAIRLIKIADQELQGPTWIIGDSENEEGN